MFARCAIMRLAMPLLGLGLVAAAPHQSALAQGAVTDMQAAYKEFVVAGVVPTVAQGREVLQKLETWNLADDALQPPQRRMKHRLEALARLAVGDAKGAAEQVKLPQDMKDADARETAEVCFLVACAGGDAKAADEALKSLNDGADAKERKQISARRRWLRQVGLSAPEVQITVQGGESFEPAKRHGLILVIDFWNMLQQPSGAHWAVLKQLYESSHDDGHAEFVGVNADSATRLEKAREFEKGSGWRWKQHYEEKMTNAPITHQAFNAGAPPWAVLVDREGYIRAVGEASEPGFQYAFRAALAEARDEYPPVPPRNMDGQRPKPKAPAAEKPAASSGDGMTTGSVTMGGKPPSNPEAAGMLRQALTYIKTGMKTEARKILQEIIDKYPGTVEAEEARGWLESPRVK